MGNGERLDDSIVPNHIDDAPVSETGHGEAGDGGKRPRVIERRRQNRARLGKEAKALLGPFSFGEASDFSIALPMALPVGTACVPLAHHDIRPEQFRGSGVRGTA